MSPLNEMLVQLELGGLGCSIKLSGESSAVIDGKAGMQAVARVLGDGLIEVAYKHSPHEITRERCSPAIAARLLRAVFSRNELKRVPVPSRARH